MVRGRRGHSALYKSSRYGGYIMVTLSPEYQNLIAGLNTTVQILKKWPTQFSEAKVAVHRATVSINTIYDYNTRKYAVSLVSSLRGKPMKINIAHRSMYPCEDLMSVREIFNDYIMQTLYSDSK